MPSELNAAYLWPQLVNADKINQQRLKCWDIYYKGLKPLQDKGKLELPVIPVGCEHNAHMFYIKCKNLRERTDFISFMRAKELYCVFHYIPLHSAPAGLKFGRFDGKDEYTTKESERLVRLPMYYGLTEKDCESVIAGVKEFFK